MDKEVKTKREIPTLRLGGINNTSTFVYNSLQQPIK